MRQLRHHPRLFDQLVVHHRPRGAQIDRAMRPERRRHAFARQHLDRDIAQQLRIVRPIHHAHPAAIDHLNQLKALQDCVERHALASIGQLPPLVCTHRPHAALPPRRSDRLRA